MLSRAALVMIKFRVARVEMPARSLLPLQLTWRRLQRPRRRIDLAARMFNLGKTTHPKSALKPDGTCKFDHVCDHFVTGKGKGGKCGGPHARTECTNPGKCDKPADA